MVPLIVGAGTEDRLVQRLEFIEEASLVREDGDPSFAPCFGGFNDLLGGQHEVVGESASGVLESEGDLPLRNPSTALTRVYHLPTFSCTFRNDVGRFASCLVLA